MEVRMKGEREGWREGGMEGDNARGRDREDEGQSTNAHEGGWDKARQTEERERE